MTTKSGICANCGLDNGKHNGKDECLRPDGSSVTGWSKTGTKWKKANELEAR